MSDVVGESVGRRADGTFVQSLDRGLAVIRAFGADRPVLTLSEVAQVTGLPRAAARRFLLTLVELGYVRQEQRGFSLRPRVLELGYSYLSSLSLPDLAQRHLDELVRAVDESSSMAVLDGPDVVYVARVHTQRIMTLLLAVGARLPAHATSMGRVLLAHLSEPDRAGALGALELTALTPRTITDRAAFTAELSVVREQGFAVVDQELELGLRSCAAPVLDRDGRAVAAVNIATSAPRVPLEELLARHVPAVVACAAAISRDLGWRG